MIEITTERREWTYAELYSQVCLDNCLESLQKTLKW